MIMIADQTAHFLRWMEAGRWCPDHRLRAQDITTSCASPTTRSIAPGGMLAARVLEAARGLTLLHAPLVASANNRAHPPLSALNAPTSSTSRPPAVNHLPRWRARPHLGSRPDGRTCPPDAKFALPSTSGRWPVRLLRCGSAPRNLQLRTSSTSCPRRLDETHGLLGSPDITTTSTAIAHLTKGARGHRWSSASTVHDRRRQSRHNGGTRRRSLDARLRRRGEAAPRRRVSPRWRSSCRALLPGSQRRAQRLPSRSARAPAGDESALHSRATSQHVRASATEGIAGRPRSSQRKSAVDSAAGV